MAAFLVGTAQTPKLNLFFFFFFNTSLSFLGLCPFVCVCSWRGSVTITQPERLLPKPVFSLQGKVTGSPHVYVPFLPRCCLHPPGCPQHPPPPDSLSDTCHPFITSGHLVTCQPLLGLERWSFTESEHFEYWWKFSDAFSNHSLCYRYLQLSSFYKHPQELIRSAKEKGMLIVPDCRNSWDRFTQGQKIGMWRGKKGFFYLFYKRERKSVSPEHYWY